MFMERQDQTLDSIQGTLATLVQQAGLMGQEIGEHNECVAMQMAPLKPLTTVAGCLMIWSRVWIVVKQNFKAIWLNSVNLSEILRVRMKHSLCMKDADCVTFIDSKSGWCIAILILILCILLLMVILI